MGSSTENLHRSASAWPEAEAAPDDVAPPIATVRRTVDLLVACVALVALSPLLAVVSLLIRWESSGAAVFQQERLGRHRSRFTVHKFRTMTVDADSMPHREYVSRLIAGVDERHDDGRRRLYKLTTDTRVTRVGRLLRRTSLDELPQLWNVIRGEMSLVGPRPVLAYEVDQYPQSWLLRFEVKPGITGLWQVSGRNERTYSEMVEYDLEYVRRRSLRLDVRILFLTLWTLVLRRGAA